MMYFLKILTFPPHQASDRVSQIRLGFCLVGLVFIKVKNLHQTIKAP